MEEHQASAFQNSSSLHLLLMKCEIHNASITASRINLHCLSDEKTVPQCPQNQT